MALLEVRNIEAYYGAAVALRGVSLDVAQGTIVAVLGANGAGKTTLLKTITGALDPRAGSITFNGVEIQGRETWDVAAVGIAHVPEGREVFRHLNVEENLRMGAYRRNDSAEVEKDLEAVYEYFPRLRERGSQHAGLLSGGEQQMVAIGRAVMARPSLMLLDEPSLGLSPLLVQEIFLIIRRLAAERGTTMLLVEQNANVALSVSDVGYVLEVGRIVLNGPSRELADNPDIREFYLGVRDAGIRGTRRRRRKKQWR